MKSSARKPFPEFQLTAVTTSPFEPSRRSRTFEEDRALRTVRRHLERNIDRKVPLAEAADVAGLEKTYFSEYFHKKVGITYVRWMNALRVAHAIERFRGSDDTIRDVSARVGYSDARTFERNFRRLTGQSATQFLGQARRRREQEEAAEAEAAADRSQPDPGDLVAELGKS